MRLLKSLSSFTEARKQCICELMLKHQFLKRPHLKALLSLVGLLLFFLFVRKNHIANKAGAYSSNFFKKGNNRLFPPQVEQRNSSLHLLIPATSSNKHLCRLLASIAATDYPAPVFIRWGSPEDDDRFVQHLAKVRGILDFLNTLGDQANDDLVLIVDGYDTWFQYGPEVLIKQYLALIEDSNARVARRLGNRAYNSIVFGADKISWPVDQRSPRTWAVPDSTLPRFAFGPETDSGRFRHHNRPRWLNSGSIIGPVESIRKLLTATIEKINKNPWTNSDQSYFAEMYAEQEYARTIMVDGPLLNTSSRRWVAGGPFSEGHYEDIELKVPQISAGQTTDFHITIDYESRLFQTTAYYWHYLGWKKFSQPTAIAKTKNAMEEELPLEIAEAALPLSRFKILPALQHKLPSNMTWHDAFLGTNVITGRIFGLIHFTPPKALRDMWWSRVWFFPYIRSLITEGSAILAINESDYITTTKDATNWYKSDLASREAKERGCSAIGGGLADATHKWLTWEVLCDAYERSVYEE